MRRFRSFFTTAFFCIFLFTTTAYGGGIIRSVGSPFTGGIESALEAAEEKGNGAVEEALEKLRSPFGFVDDLKGGGIGKAAGFIRGLVDKRYKRYTDAVQMMEDGKYDEAEEIFTELDGYEDSETMILACEYGKGKEALARERFSEALRIFEELGDYSDAKDMCLEVQYQEALWYSGKGDYLKAMESMEKLAGRGLGKAADGMNVIKKDAYDGAAELYSRGQTGRARTIFNALGDYKRSEAYSTLCTVRDNMVTGYTGNANVFKKAKEDMEPLLNDLDLADAADVVVGDTVNALVFLNGIWWDEDKKHFFNCNTSGCIYNLPFVDGVGILSFENGSYMIENDGKKHALFRFKVLDRNTVEVMCFANGETYTLKRD